MENKLIAEFMGNEWHQEFFQDVFIISSSNITYKFDTDWNWLMPVVEKIENLTDRNNFILFDVNIYPDGVIITDQLGDEKVSITKGDGFTSKIEMVYSTCVKFIKWYNKNS